jgi:hypothetical protein
MIKKKNELSSAIISFFQLKKHLIFPRNTYLFYVIGTGFLHAKGA